MQVWAADITYIPMAKGFLYLVAIMDWHSRQKLSNTMDTPQKKFSNLSIGPQL